MGWFLVLMVSLHGHTFHPVLPTEDKHDCFAKGKYASDLAKLTPIKVQWRCGFKMPNAPERDPHFPYEDGSSDG